MYIYILYIFVYYIVGCWYKCLPLLVPPIPISGVSKVSYQRAKQMIYIFDEFPSFLFKSQKHIDGTFTTNKILRLGDGWNKY